MVDVNELRRRALLGLLLLMAISLCAGDWLCGADCGDNYDCGASDDCRFCSLDARCIPSPYSYYDLPNLPNGTNFYFSNYVLAAWITSGFVVIVFCIIVLVVISWRRRQYTLSMQSTRIQTNRRSSTGFATAVANPMYGTTQPVAVAVGFDEWGGNNAIATATATVAVPVACNTQDVPVATAVY